MNHWLNPISGSPGQIQNRVDPKMLRPSRDDLIVARLKFQRQLLLSGQVRFTPIIADPGEGVIIDWPSWKKVAARKKVEPST